MSTSMLNSHKFGENVIEKYVSPIDMDTEFNSYTTNTGELLFNFSVNSTASTLWIDHNFDFRAKSTPMIKAEILKPHK